MANFKGQESKKFVTVLTKASHWTPSVDKYIYKVQEHTNKCTILQYSIFTINTLELRQCFDHFLWVILRDLYRYLYKTKPINSWPTVRGSKTGGGEIFRTCPDRPWGPPSLLYNGYRVFPGGKDRPGRDADPSPPSSAVGHKRVEVYLYSPYGPYGLYRASVPLQECTLL